MEAADFRKLEDALAQHLAYLQGAVSQHSELVRLVADARAGANVASARAGHLPGSDVVHDQDGTARGTNHLTTPLLGGKTLTRQSSSDNNSRPDEMQLHKSRKSLFFPEVEGIKSSVQDARKKTMVNTRSFLDETGCWQALVCSTTFQNLMLAAIILNSMWLAVDTDLNKADLLCEAPLLFQVVDNAFCFVFTAEIAIRFMAFKRKLDAFKDSGFGLDAFLVSLMVWETWIMVGLYKISGSVPNGAGSKSASILRIFRLFRLIRVARMMRLLKSFPELYIMVKALWVGVRSVLSIMVLLILLVYVFAIIFAQLLSGTQVGIGKFDTVPQAMNFLLLQTICGFDPDFIMEVLSAGWEYYVILLLFLLMGSLTIMNMLIGILCEVVASVAQAEKDESFAAELEFQSLRLAKLIDMDQNGMLDQNDFELLVIDPEILSSLEELDVDVVAISDYAKFIFTECDEINFNDFAHLVGQFRADRGATVKDFMDLRRFFALQLEMVRSSLATNVKQMFCELKESQKVMNAIASSKSEPLQVRVSPTPFGGRPGASSGRSGGSCWGL